MSEVSIGRSLATGCEKGRDRTFSWRCGGLAETRGRYAARLSASIPTRRTACPVYLQTGRELITCGLARQRSMDGRPQEFL